MAFNVGAIIAEIKGDITGLEKALAQSKGSVSSASVAIGTLVGNLASRAISGIVSLVSDGIGKITNFVGDAIETSKTFENAIKGVQSVGSKLGIEADDINEAMKSLRQDGLLSVADAATSLKNLFATGFNLEESIKLINTFKDSAAFGRQSTLSFGEAVRTATEGIKNQNSILVDNAGITKNLSVILKEAGLSANDLGKVSSDAGVRQALLNGIIAEGALFAGDAKLASDGLVGAQARLKTSADELKSKIGKALTPAYTDLINALDPVIKSTEAWFDANQVEILDQVDTAVGALIGSFPDFQKAITDVGNGFLVFTRSVVDNLPQLLKSFGELVGAGGRLFSTLSRLAGPFAALLQNVIVPFVDSSVKALDGFITKWQLGLELVGIDTGIFGDKVKKTADTADPELERVAGKADKVAESFNLASAAAEGLLSKASGIGALGTSGGVLVQVFNLAGFIGGRDSAADLLLEQGLASNSNQTGQSGGGETPPGF